MMLKRVDIIGPYPPPYGGVSVHISRLIYHLRKRNIFYKVYDQYFTRSSDLCIEPIGKSLFWWFAYFFGKTASVVHFHQFSFLVLIYSVIFSYFKKSKVFVTIHNERILNGNIFLKIGAIFLMKIGGDCLFIIVSKRLYSLLTRHGVKNVIYLPAYIAPVGGTNNILGEDLTGPIVFFNAWRLSDSNAEIYGFDLLIEAAKNFSNFNFYCFVGDSQSAKYVEDAAKYFDLINLRSLFGLNMVDYMNNANIFLRLNREDAYGISVKEALDCGVPAIASDVCDRAEGAVLFENGSIDSLFASIRAVVSDGCSVDSTVVKPVFYHDELIDLYNQYLM